MYTRWLRIVLIIVALLLGVRFVVVDQLPFALACFCASALLTWGYFRYGAVWLAFRSLSAGEFDKARGLLAETDPATLNAQHRAYYEWVQGVLASERDDGDSAVKHLRTALGYNLRSDNDRALVEALLAGELIDGGAGDEARALIAAARERDHKPQVDSMLDELEQRLDDGDAAQSSPASSIGES